MFIIYGQNPKLGEFLENKVARFLKGEAGVRSTQTISIKQLIIDYNFDIICINKSKDEVRKILSLKSKSILDAPINKFLSLDEYAQKYQMKAKNIQNIFNPNNK